MLVKNDQIEWGRCHGTRSGISCHSRLEHRILRDALEDAHERNPTSGRGRSGVSEHLAPQPSCSESMAADWRLLDRCPAPIGGGSIVRSQVSSFPDPVKRRERARADRRHRQAARRGAMRRFHRTGIRALRRRPFVTAPNLRHRMHSTRPTSAATSQRVSSVDARRCYVCKQQVLGHPSLLRPAVPAVRGAELRQAHRAGRPARPVALLTGGRVKIGYQAGLKLLRAGAHLIVTTRFPRNAAARYAQEPDFGEWGRSSRDLRPRSAPHAERGGVLPLLVTTAAGWTSSSTTPARPCVARRISTRT